MKFKSGLIVLGGTALGIVMSLCIAVAIEQGPHKVTFVDAETGKAFANAEIEIFYQKFCAYSPCGSDTEPRNIFSGTADDTGSIIISGHSAQDMSSARKGDFMLEYEIIIDDHGYSRIDREKSNRQQLFVKPARP
jgi:hypothetical protein